MRPEDILNNAIASIKSGIDTVENKYDEHIKEKAVEEVNKKIDEKGLKKEQNLDEDYEAMVSDLSKDIKNDYSKHESIINPTNKAKLKFNISLAPKIIKQIIGIIVVIVVMIDLKKVNLTESFTISFSFSLSIFFLFL